MIFQSKWASFTQRKVEKVFDFFQPQKLLGTIGYHPNIHIIK